MTLASRNCSTFPRFHGNNRPRWKTEIICPAKVLLAAAKHASDKKPPLDVSSTMKHCGLLVPCCSSPCLWLVHTADYPLAYASTAEEDFWPSLFEVISHAEAGPKQGLHVLLLRIYAFLRIPRQAAQDLPFSRREVSPGSLGTNSEQNLPV